MNDRRLDNAIWTTIAALALLVVFGVSALAHGGSGHNSGSWSPGMSVPGDPAAGSPTTTATAVPGDPAALYPTAPSSDQTSNPNGGGGYTYIPYAPYVPYRHWGSTLSRMGGHHRW